MIVKEGKTLSQRIPWFYAFGGALLLVVGFLAYSISLVPNKEPLPTSPPSGPVICDAEDTVHVDGGVWFITNGQLFSNGDRQSDEHAHSGNYSCRLNETQAFGFTHELKDAKPGEQYKVEVWRYRSPGLRFGEVGRLVVECKEVSLYRVVENSKEYAEDGWERMVLRFLVPRDYTGQSIKIYVVHDLKEPIWFDDLKIEREFKLDEARYITLNDSSLHTLDLRVKDKGYEKLREKRDEAFRKWLLITEDDDWVKGRIGEGDDQIKVKLRLKGDLLDHLIGDKWSFRIAVKPPQAWNRLMTFSVQNPITRDFLSEWLYHLFLQKEDVLATRYDFLTVSLNQKNLGVYAYEEHFEKQLVESQNRREGPIVKFSEEGMWAARRRGRQNRIDAVATDYQLNQYDAAEALPFKESKTLASPQLKEQTEQARSLMEAYKYGNKSAGEVFDLDRLARYYAVTDIFKAYHGVIWHNQRFYYNPVIGRLEPIGYDGFVYEGAMNWVGRPTILFGLAEEEDDPRYDLIHRLYLDEEFVALYLGHLWRLSQPEVLENFFFDLDSEIKRRQELIQTEFDYRFDPERFLRSARQIHALLFPIQEYAIRASFTQGTEGPERTLNLVNAHPFPLRVTGFGRTAQNQAFPLSEKLFLKAFSRSSPQRSLETTAPAEAKFIFFEVPGLDSQLVSPISAWQAPVASTPSQEILAGIMPESNDLYLVEEDRITFLAGSYQTDQDILIPEGYQVYFEGGHQLDMIKGARFLSKSPVQMFGEGESPIRIFSSDGSAHGFTILQAPEKSRMSHVTFDGFNTLIDRGWVLTGAVTFYESDVDIHQCAFINNHCEDALNLVRCDFSMEGCLIANTFADGFDADFCEGSIKNSRFERTGNDGMDFSGSVILVVNSVVDHPGDKGISVGEQATVQVTSAEIIGAKLGVASKDLSKLTIDWITLRDCKTGFSAYQKKPEYGPGEIWVKDFEAEGVKRLHLIEKGSSLILRDQSVEGI